MESRERALTGSPDKSSGWAEGIVRWRPGPFLLLLGLLAGLGAWFGDGFPAGALPSLHLVAGMCLVALSLAVFGVGWFSAPISMSARMAALAGGGLIGGVLELVALLAMPGMPDFFTLNSAGMAAYFLTHSRLALAIGLVAFPVLSERYTLSPFQRWSGLFFCLGLTFFVGAAWSSYASALDPSSPGEPVFARLGDVVKYFSACLFLASAVLVALQSRYAGTSAHWLQRGALLLAASCFLPLPFAYLSNLLEVGGMAFVFAAMVGLAVLDPYAEAHAARRRSVAEKERVDVILQSVGDGIVATDVRGKIVSMNPVAQYLLGCASAECVGKVFAEVFRLVDETDGHTIPCPLNICLQERQAVSHSGHLRPVSAAKVSYPVEYMASPIIGHGGELMGAVIVFRDVSEKRRLQEATERSETLFRALFDSMFQFTCMLDVEGRVLGINRPPVDSASMNVAEVIGMPVLNTPWLRHSPSLRQKMRDGLEQARQGVFVRFASSYNGLDGTEMYLDISIKPVLNDDGAVSMMVAEARDITEHKRIADALEQTGKRLNDAQRVARIGSWERDLLEDRLIWSDEVYRILEVDPASFDVNYENFLSFVHPEDKDWVGMYYAQSLEQDVPYNIVYRLSLPDGRVKFVNERCETFRDPSGRAMRSLGTVQDVTERVLTEKRLQEASLYARSLIESNPDPLLVTDMDGRIRDANRAAEEAIGLNRDRLIGRDAAAFFSQTEDVRSILQTMPQERLVRDRPLFFRHETGKTTEVTCNFSLYQDAGGVVEGVIIVARDVSDLRQYESQLLFQATRDALTALPNRLLFRERLGQAMERARDNQTLLGVMFIDLDNFKDINDSYGHAVGDEFLRLMGRRLKSAMGESATIARMGGDEFAVLVEPVADVQAMNEVASRVLATVVEPITLEGNETSVSCSIGITLYPVDEGEVDSVLKNADTAMYRAKEAGRNVFRYFTADMSAAIRRRVELGGRLRRAVKEVMDEEFVLHYQPRVGLNGGEVTGMEALIRWNAAGMGLVSPAEFIPLAEDNGMIVPIGEWVLCTACRQAMEWRDELGVPFHMAVNLSARQFRDVDIVTVVNRVLKETGLPPEFLELELTESMLMHDTKRVLNTLHGLKGLGVSLAVDDFGTGYSSLNYLKSFPLDYLKVDRSFVMDIPRDPNDEAIVRAIISMAHSLGLKVIAEGVETKEQLDFLLAQGCEEVQGYYFSKPLPKDAIAGFFQSRGAAKTLAAEPVTG